jgi:gliding motility-associated-like protein
MTQIRFSYFIFLLFLSLAIGQAGAQSTNVGPAQFWRYSPELSEEELYRYERLLYMPREDWEVFRTDPRYNDARIRQIYRDNKGKLTSLPGMLKTMPPEDCNCWIEPDNTYTTTDPNDWPNCGGGGPGVDCWIGPINLQFDFCFYGQQINQVYFTSKGTIAFGSGYIDWTPSEFPTPINGNEPQYDQIAGFWADFDFRQSGTLKYKITSEALYVNYIDVGYFSNHEDKVNTFQMILAAEGSSVLPEGNNVQFCYQDMQFAHGDVGGSGGFGGPTPANVGADRTTGSNHIQFGRFNLSNANYNGPYGQNNNQQDGINWLDNKVFNFSVCNAAANIPPISTASPPCDTIYLCQGAQFNLGMQFLSPESNQTTTVTATQSGTGMSVNTQNGNTANVTGNFTAGPGNLGLNTVTITATDNGNPSASTTVSFTFFVLDVTPPPISISGQLAICAGGETLLSATSGFDSYQWNTGCTTPDCLIETGGDVTVIGYFGECTSTATVAVDASTYFIPDLSTNNEPLVICPGTTASVCTVEEWASYSWSVYPGYPGQLLPGEPTDEQCIDLSGNLSGSYQVIVTNDEGCQGFNIQNVEIIASFIDVENEQNSGAYCNGLEPVTFDGGYSNPADGNLNVFMLSTSANGWQGSNIVVTVTHLDGTEDSYIMTTANAFTIGTAPITVGDEICIEYVSSGFGDANNSVWIFNCSNQGQTVIGPGLTPGTIWCATSGCTSQPLFGSWNVEGPGGWSMTNMDEYNTVFTPAAFGMYNLCFTDPACGIDHCYELEFTAPPSISMSPDDNVLLCGNETYAVEVEIEDIGGTGEITWSGQGVNEASDGLSAVAGPYSNYTNTTMTATITNGCGDATASVEVQYQPNVPEPTLEDEFICNGGSITLDPIPSNQDNPNLQYVWTPSGSGATLNVTSSGTYSVVVSNLCDSSNPASAEVTLVPPAQLNPVPPASVLECNSGQVTLTVGVPAGYSISWDGGQTSNAITVSSSGNYCYDVTDNLGCETLVEGCSQVVITSAPTTNGGNSELRILCPNECEVLNMGATNAGTFTWTSNCSGLNLQGDGSLTFCSDQVPDACLGQTIQITGTVSNACGTADAEWVILPDACAITIPNVFTPNNDNENQYFEIVGLDNYPGTKLYVFNRWGNTVFETENYKNDWQARDLPEGTYFYVIELPFGVNQQIEGHVTILR